MGDTELYRPRAEREGKPQHDPITHYRDKLGRDGVLAQSQDDEIQLRMRREIDEAFQFARSEPEPAPADALECVFVPARFAEEARS